MKRRESGIDLLISLSARKLTYRISHNVKPAQLIEFIYVSRLNVAQMKESCRALDRTTVIRSRMDVHVESIKVNNGTFYVVEEGK